MGCVLLQGDAITLQWCRVTTGLDLQAEPDEVDGADAGAAGRRHPPVCLDAPVQPGAGASTRQAAPAQTSTKCHKRPRRARQAQLNQWGWVALAETRLDVARHQQYMKGSGTRHQRHRARVWRHVRAIGGTCVHSRAAGEAGARGQPEATCRPRHAAVRALYATCGPWAGRRRTTCGCPSLAPGPRTCAGPCCGQRAASRGAGPV